MVPTPQVQDPSVKVPAVTYLPEDQVSVPQEELSAALEEGKSLLQQSFTLLKAKFEGLCGDLGNHGPFIGADACTVTEQSVFLGGSMPLFVLTEVLCGSQPSKFVAPRQALLKVPPSDMDAYTGSPGDEFTMLREKQKRAWIQNNPYQVNFVSGSGVSVSSLLKNADWNIVGMVVCLRRTLPGPWELRAESDIGIAPLTWHFLLKDQSTVRALPAAEDKWASSFVRGVYKAFKLKLDLEIPRACGSPVTGGEIFQSHIDKVTACFSLCVDYSVNFISNIFRNFFF